MSEAHFIDTNVLLRLVKQEHSDYPMIRTAVERLEATGSGLYCTMQNIAELWNATTRPVERNGFGLTPEEAESEVLQVERLVTLLPDELGGYREWRKIVLQYRVSGAKVHDARLVAAMRVHQIRNLLTFNSADFSRYSDITIVDPRVIAGRSL